MVIKEAIQDLGKYFLSCKNCTMKFNKNQDENKNLDILKKEIKKIKNPYSKIMVDALFSNSDAEDFRSIIKEKVSKYIESKIKI